MAAISVFRSERVLSFKLPWYFLSSFQSTGLSVQQKKRKINFQDSGPLWFDRNRLAIFDLQVAPILPTKIRANWLFGSGEEAPNRFSRWRLWRPLRFPIETILVILIYMSSRCFEPSFESIGPGVQKELALANCWHHTTHGGRWTTHDGHWLITIAHLEHFMLRWAKTTNFGEEGPFKSIIRY